MVFSAFMIGLIGSLHCIGMCGPIAVALPSRSTSFILLLFDRISYNSGRVITYTFLGLLFGLIGQGISIAGFQQSVSIIAGVLLLFMVFLPSSITNRVSLLKPAYAFTGFLKKKFGLLFKSRSVFSTFFIGLLNGFLPCGLVYIAVAGAIASGSVIDGGVYMFIFGLGTIPMMLAVSVAGNFIGIGVRRKLNKLIPAFMIVLACLFILRGLNLGIPYISPQINTSSSIDNSVICH
jgi:sulfite exporter TauE/SafE